MDYDPWAELDRIRARLFAINFEDDELNPPQLATVEPAIAMIPNAKYVLVPASDRTYGHYSTMYASLWGPYLVEFLDDLTV